jgi:uncharacterized protein (DUF1330 family)
MPAFVISIRKATTNPAELEIYAEQAPAATRVAVKRLVTSSTTVTTLIGARIEGVSILEFRDISEARQWFDSPSYQDAVSHLIKGAEYDMFLVAGEPEIFKICTEPEW